MSGYVVRLTETKEIVGFISAETKVDLFGVVDEVCSPLCCEYRRVVNGGVVWPDPEAPQADSDNLSGPEIYATERFSAVVCDGRKWTPFTTDDLDAWVARACAA